MAPDIALKTISRHGKNRLTVLDPMCGSGTVLSIAVAEGHSAIGFDVDPLAVLMSRVAVRSIDDGTLEEAAEEVVKRARRIRSTAPPWSDPETKRFAEYWFARAQRHELTRLSRAIHEIDEPATREALGVALSRIIVTKSPRASLAADTSHSRPHRVLTESDYDTLAGFLDSTTQLARILAGRSVSGRAVASLGDSRNLQLRSGSIDLVVTSPPYLNAIDYLRGHRLALIWLGYSVPGLRAIRASSIGTERRLDHDVEPQTTSIVDGIQRLVVHPDRFPRRIVERYALDLTLFAAELARVCRRGARVVVVVGNSTLRGNFIRNDLLVTRALRNTGLKITGARTRELPEAHRYLPVNPQDMESAIAKRMRTEIVITARKCQ